MSQRDRLEEWIFPNAAAARMLEEEHPALHATLRDLYRRGQSPQALLATVPERTTLRVLVEKTLEHWQDEGRS